MHALLIGATGATGKDLLDLLLKDEAFNQVNIFVRRGPGIQHEKLKTHIIDFDAREQWKDLVKGDVLFSCLGTTLKVAGSKEAQWKIDYDYQYSFAKAAKENNVPKYILVSSAFASPDSLFFYAKMKGKLEAAIKALGFQSLAIFNPPTLIRKNSDREGEVAGVKLIRFLNKLGLFKSQQPLPTEILAKAMIKEAQTNTKELAIYKPQDIKQYAEIM